MVHDKAAQMLYTHISFLANVSIPAARKLRAKLYKAILTLEKMPYRCPVFKTNKTSCEYRQLVIGRYKIIFAINEKDATVNIKYILDSRQDNDL
jgi:plasmid stabilization system protein ParE